MSLKHEPDYSAILESLKRRHEEKYGLAILDLRVEREGGEFLLRGRALLSKQVEEARELLSRAAGRSVKSEAVILADPASRAEEGWGMAKSEILDVWRTPPPLWEGESPERNRSTQLTPQDNPFRLLFKWEDWRLIQADDLTLGWAVERDISPSPDGRERWAGLRRAAEGEAIEVDSTCLGEILAVARNYEGTPYLWGGATRKGVDCSALTQRIYREACGVLLPRHSDDQRRVGERVPFGNWQPGDIMVFRLTEKSVLHVALCLGEGKAIHASRRQGKVIVESISELLERYALISVRRILA